MVKAALGLGVVLVLLILFIAFSRRVPEPQAAASSGSAQPASGGAGPKTASDSNKPATDKTAETKTTKQPAAETNTVGKKGNNEVEAHLVNITDYAVWAGERLKDLGFLGRDKVVANRAAVAEFLAAEAKAYRREYMNNMTEPNPLSQIVYTIFFKTPYIQYLLMRSGDYQAYLKKCELAEVVNGKFQMRRSREGDLAIFEWMLSQYNQETVVQPLVRIFSMIVTKDTPPRREVYKLMTVLTSMLCTTPPYVIEKRALAIGGRKLSTCLARLEESVDWLEPDRLLIAKIAQETDEQRKQELQATLDSRNQLRAKALPANVAPEQQGLQLLVKELADTMFGITVTTGAYFETLIKLCRSESTDSFAQDRDEDTLIFAQFWFEVFIKYFSPSTRGGYNKRLLAIRDDLTASLNDSPEQADQLLPSLRNYIKELSVMADIYRQVIGIVVVEMDYLLADQSGHPQMLELVQQLYKDVLILHIKDKKFDVGLVNLLRPLINRYFADEAAKEAAQPKPKSTTPKSAPESAGTSNLPPFIGREIGPARTPEEAAKARFQLLLDVNIDPGEFEKMLTPIIQQYGERLRYVSEYVHQVIDDRVARINHQ